jgi:hypothetical protein
MKVIFGDGDVVIARSDESGKASFAAPLRQTITATVTRGKIPGSLKKEKETVDKILG